MNSLLSEPVIISCNNKQAEEQMLKQAVAIESADECHLCRMLINNFPTSKGEPVTNNSEQADKFCSTRDMCAYYLQPENTCNVAQFFVHDISKMPWGKLNDGHFIDAKIACSGIFKRICWPDL